MLASDLTSGGLAAAATAPVEETVTLPTMEVRVEVARLDGSPASTLQLGEPFWLTVATRDLRAEPQGVFAVYVDVRWDADRAVVVGPTEVVAPFVNAPSGTPAAGALDELGAFAGLDPTREGLYEVVRVPMQAVTPGELSFALDPADLLPMHALLMYGRDDLIDPADVRMVGARVVVEGGPLLNIAAASSPGELGSEADASLLLLMATLDTGDGSLAPGGDSPTPAAAPGASPVPEGLEGTPITDDAAVARPITAEPSDTEAAAREGMLPEDGALSSEDDALKLTPILPDFSGQ